MEMLEREKRGFCLRIMYDEDSDGGRVLGEEVLPVGGRMGLHFCGDWDEEFLGYVVKYFRRRTRLAGRLYDLGVRLSN